MKNVIFIICITLFCNLAYSQEDKKITNTIEDSAIQDLDEVPIYPGCKRKKSEEKRKRCMSDKVSKYIAKNYNVEVFDNLNFPEGKYTVTVMFKLNKEGVITEAKASGPHVLLEEEAVRVVSTLPTITPGKVNGEPVTIPFTIPIYLTSH